MLLVVNPGSSSLKAALYEHGAYERPVCSLSIEGIGTEQARLLPNGEFGSSQTHLVETADHSEAARLAREWMATQIDDLQIDAVGYRVVHGGERYSGPALVNEELTTYLDSITPLAPNHMPAALACLAAFQPVYPEARHVACFDTAFYAELPELARTLPIPNWLRRAGVRRYGFHGLSYSYLLDSFRQHEGDIAAHGRVIMLHLGSGASLVACRGGVPVDMTMGFTPVSGIPMSTRTGDIEPGVLLHLLRDKGMSVDQVTDLVTHQSGLLGLSGTTADMYELLQRQSSDPNAALAVEVFCQAIKKQLGAYAAVLGGVDSIIFAGGIGERSSEIRARVLSGLDFLGVDIHDESNSMNARLISSEHSRVGVHVIPTREDYTIASQTTAVIRGEM